MLPLNGIRVLDLSRFLSGPFCTQILADFGAEVIKIENPPAGEPGRHTPPMAGDQSILFYTLNRNKKSFTLDLKSDAGREIYKRLVIKSDVVLDQFKAGSMDKLGLGYKELSQLNPGLIYCAVNAYGSTGPLKAEGGHDINIQGLAGLTDLNGLAGQPPAISGIQISGLAGGALYGIIAILLALRHRDRTGLGQFCDISMLDGSLSLLPYNLGYWAGTGIIPERGKELLSGMVACYNLYETSDGRYISLGATEAHFWSQFCNIIGVPQYIRLQYDPSKQEEMKKEINKITKTKSQAEWMDIFGDKNMCVTPVLNLEEMCSHPQVQAREMIVKVCDVNGSGIDLPVAGIPIKLSRSPGQIRLDFPEAGEHNKEILESLGYSSEEIDNMALNKII